MGTLHNPQKNVKDIGTDPIDVRNEANMQQDIHCLTN